jgi:hypothetical protein
MSVGLPGTGVGGLFYLLCALAMPLRELARAVRGRGCPRSRHAAARQGVMAAGVAGGIWFAGWLIGRWLGHSPAAREAIYGIRDLPADSSSVVKVASVLIASATLVLVLGAVELAAWCQRFERRRRGGEAAAPGLRGGWHLGLKVRGPERPAA